MYFPELVRGRERESKIQREPEKKTAANKTIKWKCGKSDGMIKSITGAIPRSAERGIIRGHRG